LYKPGVFANISIDGGGGVGGPIVRQKIAAGRHTIKFLDPATGEARDTQSIDVKDGQTVSVRER
jgi:hypothetical protein